MQLKFFTEISGSHWIGQPLESWTKSNLHFLNYSNDLEPFSNIIAELVSSLFLSSMKFLTRLNNYFLVYWNFWKPSFNNAYILSIWHRYLLGSVSVDTLFKRDEPPPIISLLWCLRLLVFPEHNSNFDVTKRHCSSMLHQF